MHGGKTPRGIEAGSFKHGRYSKYLPDRIHERYVQALADKDLINLDDEIALVDARLTGQLDRLNNTGMNDGGWSRARDLFQSFRLHTSRGRRVQAVDDLNALETILSLDSEDHIAWTVIGELIEQRRKLVETERKRLSDEDKAIAIDKLMILIAAIIDIIRRHVASKDVREAIANEVRGLVAGSPSPS